MKSSHRNRLIVHLALLSVFASLGAALGADGDQADQIWYSPHSGITGSAWTYVPVVPTPWSPPNPPAPSQYYGTFSVYSDSGRLVTTFTPTGIFADFTVHLKPGTYVIVPDEPEFHEFRIVVTVSHKQFADVLINLPTV